jgi:hypothetical protein
MKHVLAVSVGATILAVVVGLGFGAPAATAQTAPPGGGSVQGMWRNADSTIRVTVNRSEAKGAFVDVGEPARRLGFKAGDPSFTAAVSGNYLHGEQTIRYGVANCHPNGRKVPIIGRMTPDGQVLAIHFYNVQVDPGCRDTGRYDVVETLWQRVPGR